MNEISITPTGPLTYKVELDDLDISDQVASVFVSIDAHSRIPQVTLSLASAVHAELRRIPANVKLTPGDHELLTLLGWTPPKEN